MIDLTKPLTTQGGHAVRDVHRLSKPVDRYEFIGIVVFEDESSFPAMWDADGTCRACSEVYNLINEPEEIEVFVNVYLDRSDKEPRQSSHITERLALAAVGHNSHLEYRAIAYPVKIPLGYGVEENKGA